MKTLITFALLCLSVIVGKCAQEQIQAENRAAGDLALHMTLQLPGTPSIVFSNLLQALELTNLTGLARMEATFDQFGTNRGYENSILEKYVFMPPGVIADDGLGGEIVIIGAQPFPKSDGTLMRSFVARMADRFRGFTDSEARVQRWIAKAGVEIPKPVPSEPIPRPENQMTAEEWDRENRHWIDPILEAALNSNSLDPSAVYTGPHGAAHKPPTSSPNTVSGLENVLEPASRNPRWATLIVGLILAATIAGAWLTKRR